MRKRGIANVILLSLGVTGCGPKDKVDSIQKRPDAVVGTVTESRLSQAKSDTTSWLTYGRTYDEQRFSPAAQINQSNVKRLGLAWYADLDTSRGQEATPLVIDGKIYVSTAWSKVNAYDARSGKLLWEYDPKVPGETAVKACCDVVNRGLAAWGDSLFIGTLDGRLIALDRNTGAQLWSALTVDQSKPYTITGAPIVIKGKVIIGNGGAELGVRGYISAYDAGTGKQLWRFYTVPANPALGRQPGYLERAAKTWTGRWWNLGGGGTVWDAMAYDPSLDLLYIGVGNGGPWNEAYRSPGGGDNLYLSSIVAIKPETGEYVWHYQTTPGDSWDFTATQHIILADLNIDGKNRKVLMQAPKNGFFYVLDRTNGKLLSAKNFVPVNWASHIDMVTGRPVENPQARYYKTGKLFVGSPGSAGAHSWNPMAFDPDEKLVFIPANLTAFPYLPQAGWKPASQGFNLGLDMADVALPSDKKVRAAATKSISGRLIAWDPVKQKERWRVDQPGPSNGGVLATAGRLVFQGNASGSFVAYASNSGQKLWSFTAQTGIVAGPITYSLDGDQYVAVMAGWGGAWALVGGALQSAPMRNVSRLLVFKLGGTKLLPNMVNSNEAVLDPPPLQATVADLAQGKELFERYCSVCHGGSAVGGNVIPDLRKSAALKDAQIWQSIVHDGALKDSGMVGWNVVMSASQIETLRKYVISRARDDKRVGDR